MTPHSLSELVKHIREGIAERKYRMIFDRVLDAHWPCAAGDRESQRAAIRAFAAQHGWSVTISTPHFVATFRALKGKAADS
jgi:hypothetical protein